MEISKDEFEVLYNVWLGLYGNPYLVIESDPKMEELFLSLERLGLISIETRDGLLYSAVETKAGAELLKHPLLKRWIPEQY